MWFCIKIEAEFIYLFIIKTIGFLSGESIAISAEFENHSSRTVIPYATLHQTQMFFANGKTRIRGSKFTVLTGTFVSSHDHTYASTSSLTFNVMLAQSDKDRCALNRTDAVLDGSQMPNDIWLYCSFVYFHLPDALPGSNSWLIIIEIYYHSKIYYLPGLLITVLFISPTPIKISGKR